MPIKIANVIEGSLASQRDINPGDLILEINGNKINDFLDLQFHGADEHLLIKLKSTNGIMKKISIIQDWESPLGIEPEMHNCTLCINNCIFCFVDQMRQGFRESLYMKDDDYRLSFIYGNFITLTNLTDMHIKRIIKQRLSPLYVSVHSTNPQLHKKMMRYNREFNIMESLNQLVKGDIELHTQIVVIPQWNDGEELKRSLKELDALGENILSIGIVPVGITKFRNELTEITPVNINNARAIIKEAEKYDRTYCSDELFLKAEINIPDENYYDGYPQLENGIGMIRLLLENWIYEKKSFIEDINEISQKLVFITGISAFSTIEKISNDINSVIPDKSKVVSVYNNFFGHTVTVTGLLTAEDIFSQVSLEKNEIAVLSSGIFNDDFLTLDGISLLEFQNKFNGQILLVDEEFSDWQFID